MFSDLVEEKYICPILVKKVKDYFTDDQNRCKFEQWYKKKYGKDYEWSDTTNKGG